MNYRGKKFEAQRRRNYFDAFALPYPNKMKQKIAFALLMGIVTTGLISFTVVSVNLGFVENFLRIWLKSWAIAYLIVVPVILTIAPQIERLVGLLFKEKTAFKDRKISV